MIALKVSNPLPLRLPAGVLTLYESGRGHAGDAMMPELAPGASEIVEFARDTALRVDEQARVDQRLHSLRIVDGLLVSEDWQERRTLYRIQGPDDRARELTIAHPLSSGWDLHSPAGEVGLNEARFKVAVPAGSIAQHEVVEKRLRESRFALLDLDTDQLAYWQGQAPDAKTRDLFAALQRLRAEEARLSTELQDLRDTETQLIADQQRLVGLIVQLGDDSAATRERRARVDAIESEIESGRKTIKKLEARLAQLGRELRQLAAFKAGD
jgi:chaperonin cofactor prefoldin